NGRRTLAATVVHGISVGSWNTNPMRPAAASAPGHSTRPLVGSLKPAMMRSAVDLPQPEGPSSETNSRDETFRLRRSSATTPLAKLLPTPLSATMGVLGGSTGTLRYWPSGGGGRSPVTQSGFGHERDPTLHFAGVKVGKFLHAQPGRLEADGAKFLADVGLLDDIGDGGAEYGADIIGHLRVPIDTEPSGQLDPAHACLL